MICHKEMTLKFSLVAILLLVSLAGCGSIPVSKALTEAEIRLMEKERKLAEIRQQQQQLWLEQQRRENEIRRQQLLLEQQRREDEIKRQWEQQSKSVEKRPRPEQEASGTELDVIDIISLIPIPATKGIGIIKWLLRSKKAR